MAGLGLGCAKKSYIALKAGIPRRGCPTRPRPCFAQNVANDPAEIGSDRSQRPVGPLELFGVGAIGRQGCSDVISPISREKF